MQQNFVLVLVLPFLAIGCSSTPEPKKDYSKSIKKYFEFNRANLSPKKATQRKTKPKKILAKKVEPKKIIQPASKLIPPVQVAKVVEKLPVKKPVPKEKIPAILQIPDESHPRVDKWMRYFTGRGRSVMTRYLERLHRYQPMMNEILQKNGLPKDLVYLSLIESGLSSRATSPVGAVGFWQFMPGTAKQYGLKMNSELDERRDPVRSTEAASSYLKGLYQLFGSWPLAMASYNRGENGVKYVVMKYHIRDFWQLADRKALPRETRDYYPKFLAARRIARDPKKYGFVNLKPQSPFVFEKVLVYKTAKFRTLEKHANLKKGELSDLNPGWKKKRVRGRSGRPISIRVPKGRTADMLAALHGNRSIKRIEFRRSKYVTYKVRKGDTLMGIARKFNSSVGELASLNQLARRSVIRAGSELRVPRFKESQKIVEDLNERALKHRVKRGETLYSIARKYGVAVRSLREKNRIAPRSVLMAGSLLQIP